MPLHLRSSLLLSCFFTYVYIQNPSPLSSLNLSILPLFLPEFLSNTPRSLSFLYLLSPLRAAWSHLFPLPSSFSHRPLMSQSPAWQPCPINKTGTFLLWHPIVALRLYLPVCPCKNPTPSVNSADAAPQKQWPRLLSRRCLSPCQADKGASQVWRLYPITLQRATRRHVHEEHMRMKTGGELCLKGGTCQSLPTVQMITIVYFPVRGENT